MNNIELIANGVSLVVAIISAYTDARYRKIFNKVTYPGFIVGILYHTLVSLYLQKGIAGFLFSLYGFLLGFGFFFIFYWISQGKKMGAGDVKLYAAVGACIGLHSTMYSLVVTAVVGLLLSVILLFPVFYQIIKTGQISLLLDFRHYPIPYGTVIGISVVIWFIIRMIVSSKGLVLPFYV
jgi:prepilin peptidase CpaA